MIFKHTKIFFTIPTLFITLYFIDKMGIVGWVCFFASYGIMDFVGILHNSIAVAIEKYNNDFIRRL